MRSPKIILYIHGAPFWEPLPVYISVFDRVWHPEFLYKRKPLLPLVHITSPCVPFLEDRGLIPPLWVRHWQACLGVQYCPHFSASFTHASVRQTSLHLHDNHLQASDVLQQHLTDLCNHASGSLNQEGISCPSCQEEPYTSAHGASGIGLDRSIKTKDHIRIFDLRNTSLLVGQRNIISWKNWKLCHVRTRVQSYTCLAVFGKVSPANQTKREISYPLPSLQFWLDSAYSLLHISPTRIITFTQGFIAKDI